MRRLERLRDFVEALDASRSDLDVHSQLGSMLERAKNSVKGSLFLRDGTGGGSTAYRAELRLNRHGILALIWSHLTAEERAVGDLLMTPCDFEFRVVQRRMDSLREGDGRTIVSQCRNAEGEFDGYALVEELRPVYRTAQQIGEMLGLPRKRVYRVIQSADTKIAEHPLLHLLLGEDA